MSPLCEEYEASLCLLCVKLRIPSNIPDQCESTICLSYARDDMAVPTFAHAIRSLGLTQRYLPGGWGEGERVFLCERAARAGGL
eukprot:740231-Rhodomonas_salina.1